MDSSFLKINLPTSVGMLLIALSFISIHTSEAHIGACYGTLGNNLPPPSEVIALCKQHNIKRIRIYDPNPSILQALQGQPISVILGVLDADIPGIANDPSTAKSWVQNNILKYKNVDVLYVSVGNEISPAVYPDIAPKVPGAMQNIYNALSAAGLGNKIKVSTTLSMEVLGQSYPPSAGAFKPEYEEAFINPIVSFLVKTGAPFLIDVYPYFVYSNQPQDVRLDYALFTAPSAVVNDGSYEYQNLFVAMVDAVHAALDKAGGSNVDVVVTETGWPSDGGSATTVENARTYNSNLVKSVRKGTPRRPGKPIQTYIFDLIDENLKSPEIEKHWGLFLANKHPKYPLTFY